jgi:hypothetical protein
MTIERTIKGNGNGLWNKGGKKVKVRRDEGKDDHGETDEYMKLAHSRRTILSVHRN